jgi:hypothetical protein
MTPSSTLSTNPSPAAAARLLAGATTLAAAGAALWWSGRAIPGPSSFDHQGVTTWLGTSDPLVAAFAVLRLAGLALFGWTALTGTIALVVHLSRLRRVRWLRRLVDRLCLPVVRRLVHAAAAGTLAAATIAPVTAGALVPTTVPAGALVPTTTVTASAEVATLTALEPAAATPPSPPASAASTDRAEIVALAPTPAPPPPGSPPSTSGTTATSVPDEPAGASPDPVPPSNGSNVDPGSDDRPRTNPAPGAIPGRVWRIEPGQHLWHVAEATMVAALGARADEEAVTAYWAALVEANRDRLVVPSDPDLVFAGQEFVLPPIRDVR